MDKEREIKRIWRDTFGDSPQWIDRYFAAHYADADSLLICMDGVPASSMLLPHYEMLFHGQSVGMGYVSGAATRRRFRGRGLMTQLLSESLRMARKRGDALVSLIPASSWLFYFYANRGFSTLMFTADQRFVACHRFRAEGSYTEADPAALFEDYAAMNARRLATVCHTADDFAAILADLKMDGGRAVAVIPEGEERPTAFAFGAPDADGETLVVKELVHLDDDSREAALEALKRHYPLLPVVVREAAHLGDTGKERPLQPYAMVRLVNPLPLLQAYAAAYPKERLCVRLTDDLLPENSGTYVLGGDGTARFVAAGEGPAVKMDAEHTLVATPNVLAAVLFSSRNIGEIFSIHTARPEMKLMMD